MKKAKYLIIGASAGGIGAAEAIREVDHEGRVIMLTAEPYPAYSRPLISDYLVDKRPMEAMLFRPPDFYQDRNIQLFPGKTAKKLDITAHTVEIDDGSKIAWDKLLLATGGLPIVPPIKGVEQTGVFTFTTLDDAKGIDQFLNRFPRRSTSAVVIGGGLIGVSVTEALLRRRSNITIIEMKERILNTILDEEASTLEENALRGSGVRIITGHTVTEVNSYSGNTVTSIALDDSRPIPCDLVIVAIGVRPRTELAIGAGIKVNRGIVVDRNMAASSPDVFACGDVAEAYDFACDENRLTPVWPNAYLGGRVAGFNMAGVPARYEGGTAMNAMKYFGLAVASAGVVNPPDKGYEVISRKSDHAYKKVVLRDGVIVGMVFLGGIEKSGIVFSLMKDRVNVDRFKKALVADDFGLISLPEEIWRQRLEIPDSKMARTSAEKETEEVVAGE